MKKLYLTLLPFMVFLNGCGQYSDVNYSCDGDWEIHKDFMGIKKSEKKKEVLPFTVNFIYLGNTIQYLRGTDYYNTYQFNREYWNSENLKEEESYSSKFKTDVISENRRIVVNNEKNFQGYIGEKIFNKSNKGFLSSKFQEFDFNRITGVIKYSSKYEEVFFISESSQFIGQCKRVEKPL